MATVDPGYAAYLQAPARYVTTIIGGQAAKYGERALGSTIISPIALKGDAQAEATRQAQFLAGPIARDTHLVKGSRRDLIGKLVTIIGDRLGYGAGVNVFVIGVQEQENGMSLLTVLRRL